MRQDFLKSWEIMVLAVVAILCIVTGCLCSSAPVAIFGGLVAFAAVILGIINDAAKEIEKRRILQ